MSIVLVVIALLASIVTVGSELIQTAKMRQTVSEMEQIATGINAFKLKYDCLPGDCAKGSQFFSGSSNGDGDGLIESGPSGGPCTEGATGWNQLYTAGLLTMPKVSLLAGPTPYGSLKQSYTFGEPSGSIFGNTKLNNIEVAIPLSVSHPTRTGCRGIDSIFSIMTSKYIDTKIDDGVANTGKIIVFDGNEATLGACSNIFSSATGSDYSTGVSLTAITCRISYFFDKSGR